MQLTTVGLMITLALRLLVVPLTAEAQPAGCAQDFPTEASLQAARTAIVAGGTDVALSPSGCLRYKRVFSGSILTREETRFDGQLVSAWDHAIQPLATFPSPFPPLPFMVASSSGIRDNDLDGFSELRSTIVRLIPLSTAGARQIHFQVEELAPGSQTVVQRRSSLYPGDGTVHVTVEAIVTGMLQVVRKFVAPANIKVATTSAGTRCNLSGPEMIVPCPGDLLTKVESIILTVGVNGGSCLRTAGLSAEADNVAQVASTLASSRDIILQCERGDTDRLAGINTSQVKDPMSPVLIAINLDCWDNASNSDREIIIFHELLHTLDNTFELQGWDHDPSLENLAENNNDRYRELDRIGACNSLCNNPSTTQCECATCLGKKACDAPCNSKAACFTSQIGGWCDCPNAKPPKHEWYDSINACAGACPSGTGCAFVLCKPEMNACK